MPDEEMDLLAKMLKCDPTEEALTESVASLAWHAKKDGLRDLIDEAKRELASGKMSLDDLIASAWVSGYGTSLMDAQDAFDFFDDVGESDRPQA